MSSRKCANCQHVVRSHGSWWRDEAYGPCRTKGCSCLGWIEELGDCPHDKRMFGWGDEVRCQRCGATLHSAID